MPKPTAMCDPSRSAFRPGPLPLLLALLLAALALRGCAGEGATEVGGAPDSGEGGGEVGGGDGGPVDRCASTAAEGCPCEGVQSKPCYDGPTGTANVGLCSLGRAPCVDGRFGACRLQVLPQAEQCNGQDDDCDGAADEELAECVPCGPNCRIVSLGPGAALTFTAGQAQGVDVRVTPGGELTLQASELVLNDVWIANTDEGTVSRLDADSGRELARYPSVRGRPELRPWNDPCGRDPGSERGNCPSRTAVTLEGDVFVANRAFAGQGSVTKILGVDCPDANGDGIVRTSSDVDGDGRILLGDPAEFPGQQDECVAFTVPVGGPNGVLRALAVDPFDPPGGGSVWVGAYEEQAVYQVDAASGEVLQRLSLPLHPYGALLDSQRTLWITSLSGVDDSLVAVDTASGTVGQAIPIDNPVSCSDHRSRGGYGISIDGVGRIWVGGWFCEDALRYDPVNGEWFAVHLAGLGYTRGVAADAAGRIWVAHSNEVYPPYDKVARVSRFSAEDGSDLFTYTLPGQSETIGVGIDSAGKVWAVSRGSDSASTIDPVSGAVTSHPTGHGPYTYSDFTGYALRTFIAPRGLWTMPLTACDEQAGPATWRTLRWAADVPASAHLRLFVRAADDPSSLALAFRHGPFTAGPVDLVAAGVPHARWLRVEVELEAASRQAAPTVRWIRLEADCPPEG